MGFESKPPFHDELTPRLRIFTAMGAYTLLALVAGCAVFW